MGVLAVYVLLGSVATFLLFGVDKRRAGTGARRIPESTLVGAAALTGTVGGWVGMRVFRHKTAKTSFKARMVGATVLDVVVVALLVRALV